MTWWLAASVAVGVSGLVAILAAVALILGCQRARYINVALWFYLFASDVLNPVTTKGDFWTEKANQALQLNGHVEDPPRLLGNAISILALWFATDLFLRWLRRFNRAPTP
jgi:hypothetical protein